MPSDIGLIFGMWVNHDELQIKFKFRSAQLIFAKKTGFGLWEIVENHSYTDFFSKRFQILGWILACELTKMSYRSSLSFVPLGWFLTKLWAMDFDKLLKITVIQTFFPNAWQWTVSRRFTCLFIYFSFGMNSVNWLPRIQTKWHHWKLNQS